MALQPEAKLAFRYLLLSVLFSALMSSALLGQKTTQVVKGQILDAQSSFPLPGATVLVVGSDPLIGVTTDGEGRYRLEGVPTGRVTLYCTYIGYLERSIPNVVVTAGKEVVVDLTLEESVTTMKEVEVKAGRNKARANNEMAAISIRGFNLEETSRYAGSFNDPARMASNYAGVTGGNDTRNDIIIRGNSPRGLLWRLEGLDIPNPNHFANTTSSGGAISLLNNNQLADSDFLSGAFPAEYGNALSGVFDLKMRTGNREKHEFMGQVGFNGFEVGAEGPFTKGGRSSYMVNYRYSVLSFFDAVGIDLGTGAAVPEFQDVSFKVDLPTQKTGRFTVFGVGGRSSINLLGSESDPSDTNTLFGSEKEDTRFISRMGVMGVTHTHFIGKKSFSRIILAASHLGEEIRSDSVFRDNDFEVTGTERYFSRDLSQEKYTANYRFNRKFNARNTLVTGVIYEYHDMRLTESHSDFAEMLSNFNGGTSFWQAYAQWKHRFTDQLTLNSGIHGQWFALNGSNAIEPRVGLSYRFRPNQSLSLGIGRHHQLQPLDIYFLETMQSDGSIELTNFDLDFTRSDHLVVGYDISLTEHLRVKTEAYYQRLANIPIRSASSHFSLINSGGGFGLPAEDSLVNEGTGFNRGVELTLERFFHRYYYFLTTISLYDSRYTGSDGVERNTTFNGNYVFNLLGGREWKVGKGSRINVSLRGNLTGNSRYIPVDLEASRAAGVAVLDYDRAYDVQLKPYYRFDIKASWTLDGKKVTQEWVFDIQNVTNHRNVFSLEYNEALQDVREVYQYGLLPVFQYKVLF